MVPTIVAVRQVKLLGTKRMNVLYHQFFRATALFAVALAVENS
jgi:hypothetical protein